MKKLTWICLAALLLAACSPQPTQAPIYAGPVGKVTVVPPRPIKTFVGCAVKVDHPGNFVPEEEGENVVFTAPSEEGVSASIKVRRRASGEENARPQDLMTKLIEQAGASKIRPAVGNFDVKDDQNNVLSAAQTDFVKDWLHYRLIVIVRPNTKLPDGLAADAIYEIIATAPEASWYIWSELYKGYFNTFQPKDCE